MNKSFFHFFAFETDWTLFRQGVEIVPDLMLPDECVIGSQRDILRLYLYKCFQGQHFRRTFMVFYYLLSFACLSSGNNSCFKDVTILLLTLDTLIAPNVSFNPRISAWMKKRVQIGTIFQVGWLSWDLINSEEVNLSNTSFTLLQHNRNWICFRSNSLPFNTNLRAGSANKCGQGHEKCLWRLSLI